MKQVQAERTYQAGLYDVTGAPPDAGRIIPRRRGPIRPIPGLTMYEAEQMKLDALNYAGLEGYNPCWTFEPKRRSIPFVSTDPKPQKVLETFERYGSAILDFIVPQMKAHTQTYNKKSSAGYPVHSNPKTFDQTQAICQRLGIDAPSASNKFDLLTALFPELDAGDISRYKTSFSTQGGRLQYEPPDKERRYLFIDDEGRVYEDVVTRSERTEYIEELNSEYVGSRYRGVINPAVINLYIQNWDTMLHGAIMQHPVADANMYTRERWPGDAQFTTFDFKHYERYTGLLVFAYAKLIGGRYGEWLAKLASDPYLVPSDTKKSAWLIKPRLTPGQYPQLGSGIACVATIGKLANIAVTTAYFAEVRHMSIQNAVATAFSGIAGNMRFWMYGDDNRLLGPAADRNAFLAWHTEHFEVEVDDHPKYLGFVYRPDLQRFVLPRTTYNLKLYLRERDYEWYAYPSLGNMLRRETFSLYGEPEIASHIIPHEDELFESVGHPYQEMVANALGERRKANSRGEQLAPEYVTDKDYLLSAEEQIESGLFWGLPEIRTREIVHSLVSEPINKLLRI
jgi:hypothetical protein